MTEPVVERIEVVLTDDHGLPRLIVTIRSENGEAIVSNGYTLFLHDDDPTDGITAPYVKDANGEIILFSEGAQFKFVHDNGPQDTVPQDTAPQDTAPQDTVIDIITPTPSVFLEYALEQMGSIDPIPATFVTINAEGGSLSIDQQPYYHLTVYANGTQVTMAEGYDGVEVVAGDGASVVVSGNAPVDYDFTGDLIIDQSTIGAYFLTTISGATVRMLGYDMSELFVDADGVVFDIIRSQFSIDETTLTDLTPGDIEDSVYEVDVTHIIPGGSGHEDVVRRYTVTLPALIVIDNVLNIVSVENVGETPSIKYTPANAGDVFINQNAFDGSFPTLVVGGGQIYGPEQMQIAHEKIFLNESGSVDLEILAGTIIAGSIEIPTLNQAQGSAGQQPERSGRGR